MRLGQQVEMVEAVDTTVPAGALGYVVALEPPAGRARVAWETGIESVLPGTRDHVIVRGPTERARVVAATWQGAAARRPAG
jgi:hypothetical protein